MRNGQVVLRQEAHGREAMIPGASGKTRTCRIAVARHELHGRTDRQIFARHAAEDAVLIATAFEGAHGEAGGELRVVDRRGRRHSAHEVAGFRAAVEHALARLAIAVYDSRVKEERLAKVVGSGGSARGVARSGGIAGCAELFVRAICTGENRLARRRPRAHGDVRPTSAPRARTIRVHEQVRAGLELIVRASSQVLKEGARAAAGDTGDGYTGLLETCDRAAGSCSRPFVHTLLPLRARAHVLDRTVIDVQAAPLQHVRVTDGFGKGHCRIGGRRGATTILAALDLDKGAQRRVMLACRLFQRAHVLVAVDQCTDLGRRKCRGERCEAARAVARQRVGEQDVSATGV